MKQKCQPVGSHIKNSLLTEMLFMTYSQDLSSTRASVIIILIQLAILSFIYTKVISYSSVENRKKNVLERKNMQENWLPNLKENMFYTCIICCLLQQINECLRKHIPLTETNMYNYYEHQVVIIQTGLILGLCPADERRRYKVTPSLIGGRKPRIRADSRLVPSQWETSLQSNAVSHWLGANLESAL